MLAQRRQMLVVVRCGELQGFNSHAKQLFTDHGSTEALWKHAGLHYFVSDLQILNVQQVV